MFVYDVNGKKVIEGLEYAIAVKFADLGNKDM
jgi:hypothetical protein